MNIGRLRPANAIPYTWYLVPDYQDNPNARQQGGVLTYVRHAEPYFMANGVWPTHDSLAHFEEGESVSLRKLILRSNQRAVLAELLLKEGWSLMQLKPSLESVSKTVEITFPWAEGADVADRANRCLEASRRS